MDILLDSNIYIANRLLRSPNLEVLIDYIKTTKSNLILPQVIIDEVKGNYIKELKAKWSELNTKVRNLNDFIWEKEKEVAIPEMNAEEMGEKYIAYLKQKFKRIDVKIIPYQNHFLPEISQRAISRRKPCGPDGQGFRDTLIWLTLKEYTKQKKRQVVFVSGDGGDFRNSAKYDLHEDLREECDIEHLAIVFYPSLSEFNKSHSKTIGFVTKEWLAENINWESFVTDVDENLKTRGRSISGALRNKFPELKDFKHHVAGVTDYSISNFFINEKSDKSLIIEVHILIVFLVEYVSVSKGDSTETVLSWENNITDLSTFVELTLTVIHEKVVSTETPEVFMRAGYK